jgi:hypothetical protein
MPTGKLIQVVGTLSERKEDGEIHLLFCIVGRKKCQMMSRDSIMENETQFSPD